MEAFCGPPKAETKETFLCNYHGKTNFHKNGDVSQKVNLPTEFQVFVRFLQKREQLIGWQHLKKT